MQHSVVLELNDISVQRSNEQIRHLPKLRKHASQLFFELLQKERTGTFRAFGISAVQKSPPVSLGIKYRRLLLEHSEKPQLVPQGSRQVAPERTCRPSGLAEKGISSILPVDSWMNVGSSFGARPAKQA